MTSRPAESGRGGAAFDTWAHGYDAELDRGLAPTGEPRSYFIRHRVAWLAEQIEKRGARADSILDFGCGTGSTTPLLQELISPPRVVGVDPSSESLDKASRHRSAPGIEYVSLDDLEAQGEFDVVYCNGVFHHIEPIRRPALVDVVKGSLREGGLFSFWENNAWNPGTRYLMRRVVFDRDAWPISPLTARRLLRGAGLDVLSIDHLFFFPRALRLFRGLERGLVRLPLGGQYHVLCRKPAPPSPV